MLRNRFVLLLILFAQTASANPPASGDIVWKHVSSSRTAGSSGSLPAPSENKTAEQTSSIILDADKDGTPDFAVTERSASPSMVLYRRQKSGAWKRQVIEPELLPIEAGSLAADVDHDGDPDLIAAGDHRSRQIWWWENPFPRLDAGRWKRRLIKDSGANKHHDQLWGDFDGDGRAELLFWNQGGHRLMRADPPADPRAATQPWTLTDAFVYSVDGQPDDRIELAPDWKGVNEHEGLAAADIDGDGILDAVGGGYWFKFTGGTVSVNPVDPGYTFTRCAVGQLKKGGRPEIALVVGDGRGPLLWYEWEKGIWRAHKLVDGVQDGHSLQLADVDGDGNPDIFSAEMRISGGNPGSRMRLFLGDGAGVFRESLIAVGHDNHETKLVDLDGDGDLDILGKPFNFETPSIEIWLNQGKAAR